MGILRLLPDGGEVCIELIDATEDEHFEPYLRGRNIYLHLIEPHPYAMNTVQLSHSWYFAEARFLGRTIHLSSSSGNAFVLAST